jgi:hypothetical protein
MTTKTIKNVGLEEELKACSSELSLKALSEIEHLKAELQKAVNERNEAWFAIEEYQDKQG